MKTEKSSGTYNTVEEAHAEMLRLNKLGGYTRKEIGELVGLSEATASRVITMSMTTVPTVASKVDLHAMFDKLWHTTD